MENKLAIALVNKGVLVAGTEVRAKHKAVGLGSVNKVIVSGDFSISKIEVQNEKVKFYLADLRTGSPTTVFADAVEDIDGMDPVRFASVYDITEDGEKAVIGKRRGRKPKSLMVEDANDIIDDEDEDDDYV